ncbi:hypothetical protein SAMN05660284_00079 [Formivibrio citricus]|uniref:Tetratricopeptide repeat-containing protein n=1 Tax=Formivibrio citricus TaxID=83765 RepID=A0A1I4V238_9NEIS|nr:hypothetical protein [Formivibrio citricus]SFM95060.1 hypothetical protein SAMN05660284_00079 [Formivibrio citricus]
MRYVINFIVFLCFFSCIANAKNKYETRVEKIPLSMQALFFHAQHTLDGWAGERNKLDTASKAIDDFIKLAPNFLPIYIEKSRLIIMNGAMRGGDFKKANEEALRILLDVQKKNPKYAKAYVLAGHVYTNIYNFPKAYEMLGKAESLKTSDPWLYINYATLMALTGHADKGVEYAKKGLVAPGGAAKSISSAIGYISKYSKNNNIGIERGVVDVVFLNIKRPQDRLALANRLISSYEGRHDMLVYANAILERQKKETPGRGDVDLTYAKLILANGYLVNRGGVSRYDADSAKHAEGVLNRIKSNAKIRDEAMFLLVKICLSRDDRDGAKRIIGELESAGNSSVDFYYWKFVIEYSFGDYAKSLDILSDMGKKYPVYASELMADNFYVGGRESSIKQKDEVHKESVYKNPNSAWVLGNYASFLLYRKHDVDAAIQYGERALKQMDYGVARADTSLAYLVKASIEEKAGNREVAMKLFNRASEIGYSFDYVKKNCTIYCNGVLPAVKKFEESR